MKNEVICYFESLTKDSGIWLNNDYLGGIPCIAGTRIPVSQIISDLSSGFSREKIMSDYNINEQDIKNAVLYTSNIFNNIFSSK